MTPSPFIQTVLGPVSPDAIGVTDCHDHLFITGGVPVLRYPDFKLDDYARICGEMGDFRSAGGSAIIEMSPIDWGRDAAMMTRASRESNVHVIAATGFHKLFYYPDSHWVHHYSEDELVDLIVSELLEGMDGYNYSGPIVRRVAARAGVIKVGTQVGRFNATEEKLLQAAARAHLATGAPILTHTDEGALAFEQVEYLKAQGVPAGKIGLSHVDRCLDLGFHKELAATGVFLEYDAATRVTKGFDKSTAALVLGMVAAGLQDHLLLGADISRQGYWRRYGGAPGLAFLVGPYREQLAGSGLSTEMLRRIYVENPRALLVWQPSAGSSATPEPWGQRGA